MVYTVNMDGQHGPTRTLLCEKFTYGICERKHTEQIMYVNLSDKLVLQVCVGGASKMPGRHAREPTYHRLFFLSNIEKKQGKNVSA